MATATVIEECQCSPECYRKSYYEKATKIADIKQEVVMHNINI